MADRMEVEDEGTSEESLPGIGELKTFSQVRRPRFLIVMFSVVLYVDTAPSSTCLLSLDVVIAVLRFWLDAFVSSSSLVEKILG